MTTGEATLRSIIVDSCGNCGIPTDHAIGRIAALVWRGVVTLRQVRDVSSIRVTRRVIAMMKNQRDELRRERERERQRFARKGVSEYSYPSDME